MKRKWIHTWVLDCFWKWGGTKNLTESRYVHRDWKGAAARRDVRKKKLPRRCRDGFQKNVPNFTAMTTHGKERFRNRSTTRWMEPRLVPVIVNHENHTVYLLFKNRFKPGILPMRWLAVSKKRINGLTFAVYYNRWKPRFRFTAAFHK